MLFTWVRQLRGVVVRSPSSYATTATTPANHQRTRASGSSNRVDLVQPKKRQMQHREIGTGTGRREQPAAKGAFWSRQVQQESLVLPAPTHCKGTPPVISTAPQPPAVSHALEQGGAGVCLASWPPPFVRGAPCPLRPLPMLVRGPQAPIYTTPCARAGAGGRGGGLPVRLE